MTAPVARDQVDPLRQRLIEIGNAIDESDALPYRRSTALHFVRWVVIDEQELPNGKKTAPCLSRTCHCKTLLKNMVHPVLCIAAGPSLKPTALT